MRMGLLRVQAWSLLAAAFVAASCSAGRAQPASSAAPVAVPAPATGATAPLQAGIDHVCEAFGRCCATGGFPFRRASCEAELRRKYAQPDCQPGESFDAQAASACLARMAELMTTCAPEQDIPVCARICTGSKPLGAACTTTRECARNDDFEVLCRPTGGAKVCAAARAAQGEACNTTFGLRTLGRQLVVPGHGKSKDGGICNYDDGLYCDPDDRCAPLVPLGGPCEQNVACGPDGRCQPQKHKCIPAARVGEPCWDYWACEDKAYCADGIKVCKARKPTGEDCTFERQCLGGCMSGTCGEYPPNVPATRDGCAAGIF